VLCVSWVHHGFCQAVTRVEAKLVLKGQAEQLSEYEARSWSRLTLTKEQRRELMFIESGHGDLLPPTLFDSVLAELAASGRPAGVVYGPVADAPLGLISFVTSYPEPPAQPEPGLSYDPELRRMGLKVGRDGNLYRVGPDARDPRDPDEGPAVEWEELHRKQFGH
jgi:hypothetical protein